MIRIIMVLVLVFFSIPAHAAAEKLIQNMQYDVYAGGIHALKANLNVDLSVKNRYTLSLKSQTYGLLGKLAPWQGIFKTEGWKVGDAYKPELHESIATWKGEEEIKKYRYKKDGSFAGYSLKDDSNDGSIKPVDDELTQGTSDVLSATLVTMQSVAMSNKCEGTSEIFDGKRRFKLIFKEKKKVMLDASRYNLYSGEAIECSAEVQPVAGEWHENPRGWMSIQEQGRERGTMPTVWFAKMAEGQPAIPVKVRVKTSYGTLFMHLTQYQGGGKKMTLKD